MSEEESFRTKFWNIACQYEGLIKFALAVDVTILVLLVIASFGIDPTDPGYYILVIDFVILAPLLLVTVYLLYRCQRHTVSTGF